MANIGKKFYEQVNEYIYITDALYAKRLYHPPLTFIQGRVELVVIGVTCYTHRLNVNTNRGQLFTCFLVVGYGELLSNLSNKNKYNQSHGPRSDPKSGWAKKRALSECNLGVGGRSPRKNFSGSSSLDRWKPTFSYDMKRLSPS